MVLVGPMGAGKTTLADLLAQRWGVAVRDTDPGLAPNLVEQHSFVGSMLVHQEHPLGSFGDHVCEFYLTHYFQCRRGWTRSGGIRGRQRLL